MTTFQIKRINFMFYSRARKILKVSRDTLEYTSCSEGLYGKYELSLTQEMASYRHFILNNARPKKKNRNTYLDGVFKQAQSIIQTLQLSKPCFLTVG